MAGFLSAHGYEPGPTQRPLSAGAITGLLATVPAIGLLYLFGSLGVEARILRTSVAVAIGAGCVLMAGAGAVYARLFGRAANDVRGGWLLGMAFGFALWTAGAVTVLPIVSGGLAPAGRAAVGLFVSLVMWGAVLGALLPSIHRRLHASIEEAAGQNRSGPTAAATKDRRRPDPHQENH